MSAAGSAPDAVELEAWRRVADARIAMLRVPTPFAVGRVNCYLIDDDPLTLVDAGPRSDRALGELEAQLRVLDRSVEEIELIVVTHQHIDHSGLIETIVTRSGAAVAGIDVLATVLAEFGDDAELQDRLAVELMLRNGVPADMAQALAAISLGFREFGAKATVTRTLADGDRLELRDRALETQYRPGHSPTDTLFYDAERAILLAGDHLIKHISSNALISRPLDGSPGRTRSLLDYVVSLKRTREVPAEVVLSGHGEPITDHRGLIDTRLGQIQRRAEKIYGLLAGRPRSAHELAVEIWGNVAVTQAFLTLSEVIGHLDLLIEAGHVRELEDRVIRYEAMTEIAPEELGDLIPGGNPAAGGG